MTAPDLTSGDLWTIAVAVCCSVACGTIGCFLVLRRLSLLGDAISHAVLPGIAVAFMLTGSREPWAMLGGALAIGLLTAGLATGVRRLGRLPEDAALGVVFTSLFALGVLLITWVAPSIDLDPGCVLYGLLEFVPLDMVTLIGADAADSARIAPGQFAATPTLEVPRALLWQAGLMLGNLTLITVIFKELRIASFDAALATTMGLSAAVVHGLMLTSVAATTVISFEAVGSILVVAMLVAPGATAQLLTDRLGRMVMLSGVLGASAAIIGYLLAVWLDASASGMISVVAGSQFAVAAVAAPRYGVVGKLIRNARLSQRIAREDVLGLLYRVHESGDSRPASLPHAQVLRAVAPGFRSRLACWQLRAAGLIQSVTGDELALTPKGVEQAAQVIRAHRLWETFLSRNLPLPLDHLHEPSERLEHFLTPEIQAKIAAEVGDRSDPHGKQIPSP